jgi:SAM-dependent methyltransferase
MPMSRTEPPAARWESFWRDAPADPEAVFWDAGPDAVAAAHLPLFAPYLSEPLPLVDLGCGNGTQTAHLARHHPGPVIGADLSAEATDRARRRFGGDFRRLDAADTGAVAALHAELGDSHVYVRGLFHHAAPADRAAIAAGLARLLGTRGRAFVVEPAAAAKTVLHGLMGRPGGPPPAVAAIFTHGITPMEMADASVTELFAAAGLAPLATGSLPLATTERHPDGSRVELPSNWLVIGHDG